MTRHAILYDVVRWRRNRLWLLVPAALAAVVAVLLVVSRPGSQQAQPWALLCAVLLAVATAMWVRQRTCDLRVDGTDLLIRVAAARRRVPLAAVRRVRVQRLGAALDTPARRRNLPGGGRARDAAWLEAEAVVLRLRDDDLLVPLRRLLRRCVVDRELVVPVLGAVELAAAIEAALPPPSAPARPTRRRRR